MSTTRKIEGLASRYAERNFEAYGDTRIVAKDSVRDTGTTFIVPATLIIGGKALTEEEHEAEFQRRAKALVSDLKDQTMSIAVEQSIDRIAAKHGITP